jgi:hypothetical protein
MNAIGQVVILSLSFWLGAIALMHSHARDARPIVGLALCGLLAHWGWCALHVGSIGLREWLDPTRGATILALPLGFAGVAPWQQERVGVLSFLGSCWLHLLPCLAVARIACWVAGCCLGKLLTAPLPWPGLPIDRHPVAAYEIVAWCACWVWLRRVPTHFIPARFALVFGSSRLLLCLLREPPSHGFEAHASPELLAAVWASAGLAGLLYEHAGTISTPAPSAASPNR